jgi:diguanylate cyclase (GGDEF)-like protein
MTRLGSGNDHPAQGGFSSGHHEVLREVVSRIGALLAETREIAPLAQLVAETLSDAVGGNGCDVYVYSGGDLRCVISLEDGEVCPEYVGEILDFDDYPLTRLALETGEVLVVSDRDDPRLTDFEREEMAQFERRSELEIPLLIDEQVVGLVDVFSRASRDFDDDLELCRSVGQIAAGAIANSLLFDQLERSNEDLRTLVDCGRQFGATLNPEAVMASVAEAMRNATGAACCDLFEFVADGISGLVSVEAGGVDADFPGAFYKTSECLAAKIAVDGDDLFMAADATVDERMSSAERADFAEWGYHAVLVLPLRTSDKLLGVAFLYDTKVREFTGLDLLTGLTQVAAQSLANASLHRSALRSAERLALVSEAGLDFSSSLTLEEVLEKTVSRLRDALDVSSCYVFKLDGDALDCVAAVSLSGPSRWLGKRVGVSDWASSYTAVTTGHAVVIETTSDPRMSDSERREMDEAGEKSALVMPLTAKERVLGTVELVEERHERGFSDDEIETVRSICHVAGLAIDNADLYRGLELRGRETELLNEIARRASTSLDIREIAAAVVDGLRHLVRFERAGLVLVDENGVMQVAYTYESRGALEALLASRPGAAVFDRVARGGVVRLTLPDDFPDDVSRDLLGPLRSGLFVRLTAGATVIGGFGLVSERVDAFTRVDDAVIEGVATHLSLALNNARMYESVKKMHLANLKALSWALNAKDYYTLGHAVRVSAYMALLGKELGWPLDLSTQVEEASYLHDIGKIGISDQVLLKPGRLNDREWDLMRNHPVYGADTIGPLFDSELVRAVRHHHERYDGAGYPDGLAGDEIPEIARAMCVADSYDAMSLRRPYRRALTYSESVAEMKRCRGKQFDPDMTDAFMHVLSDLEQRRKKAVDAARLAARRIDIAKHAELRTPTDEATAGYAEIREILRGVAEKHLAGGTLMTFARRDGRYVYVVDGDDDENSRCHIGDEVFTDQELPEAFAGVLPDMNALLVDQYGIWLGGRVPVLDANGEVVAVVGADVPPMDVPIGALRSDVSTTLATLLASGEGRLKRAEFEAITDGLTGLYTHRYFQERLGEELERARLQSQQVALIVCDLDGFREFNQRNGHAAGDRALHEIARVIESAGRQIDLPARYAGQQFALVLIDADPTVARDVAERIRDRVGQSRVTPQGDRLTVSLGFAGFPGDATTKDELVDKAEWALHMAKRQGRDGVVAFSETLAAE